MLQWLRKLKTLRLWSDQVTEAGLAELCSLDELELLQIVAVQLTPEVAEKLCNIRTLKKVDLEGPAITLEIVAKLKQRHRKLQISGAVDADEDPRAR